MTHRLTAAFLLLFPLVACDADLGAFSADADADAETWDGFASPLQRVGVAPPPRATAAPSAEGLDRAAWERLEVAGWDLVYELARAGSAARRVHDVTRRDLASLATRLGAHARQTVDAALAAAAAAGEPEPVAATEVDVQPPGPHCTADDGYVSCQRRTILAIDPGGRRVVRVDLPVESGGTGCADLVGVVTQVVDGEVLIERRFDSRDADCMDRSPEEADRIARRVNAFIDNYLRRGWRPLESAAEANDGAFWDKHEVALKEGPLAGYRLRLDATRWWLQLHLIGPDGRSHRLLSQAQELVECWEDEELGRECRDRNPYLAEVVLVPEARRLLVRVDHVGDACWSSVDQLHFTVPLPNVVRL